MEHRKLGTTNLKVSALCLGTMTWGQQNTEQEGHAQMDMGFEKGINFFDTAELYPIPPKRETQGRTEEIIGTWFAARKNRDKIILASKVCGRSQMDWFRNDGALPQLTRAQIFEAVDKSLKRLQTDYIDLYQLHWPDRPMPQFGGNPVIFDAKQGEENSFESIFDALADVVKQGKARHIGLSNESAWGVMRALSVHEHSARDASPSDANGETNKSNGANEHSARDASPSDANGETNKSNGANERGDKVIPRVQSLQNAYNLLNRTNEINLAEIVLRENIAYLPYSPLAQGYLTGKYQNGAIPKGSRKSIADRLQRYETPGADSAIEAYLKLARDHNVDPSHLAIQFVTTRPFVTSNIIGATSLEQLAHDIGSLDMKWTDELEQAVNDVHLRHTNPCP